MIDAGPLHVPILDRHIFDPVSVCIYCGSPDDLTDEHIVAYGLGGNLVLPHSSCRCCAKITGRIELTVLRGPFRPIRVFRGIQSRSRHRDAPTKLPLKVRRGDTWDTVYLPHSEFPLLLHYMIFAPPGLLDPEGYTGGIRVRGHLTYSFGPRPEAVCALLGADEVRIRQQDKPSEFAKMVAKIAYAMAVARGVIDPRIGRPDVLHDIVGGGGNIGNWVGTITEPLRRVPGVLHYVGLERDREKNLLIGRVQILADSGTPEYGVILGNLDEPFIRKHSADAVSA